EKNHQVRMVQRVDAGNVLALGTFQVNAVETVVGFQKVLECRQGLRRFVFVFARYQDNRQRARRLGRAGVLIGKEQERQKAWQVKGESFHGFFGVIELKR